MAGRISAVALHTTLWQCSLQIDLAVPGELGMQLAPVHLLDLLLRDVQECRDGRPRQPTSEFGRARFRSTRIGLTVLATAHAQVPLSFA